MPKVFFGHRRMGGLANTAVHFREPEELQDSIPTWPISLAIAGYPLWWFLGLGDLAFAALSIPMVAYLVRTMGARVKLPSGFGWWALYLLWVVCSGTQLDSIGRSLGFLLRMSIYFSATVFFLYVYNARGAVTRQFVARTVSLFLLVMTIGGSVGLLFPLWSVKTPLFYLLPRGMLANEVVSEMAIRRVTQFNPDAWAPLFPRPSAPFLYTNGWGFAYAVTLPIAIAYLISQHGKRDRWWLIPTVIGSLIPAFLSLNRGMFIGLGVTLIYVLVRLIAARKTAAVAGLLGLLVVAGSTFVLLPSGERLEERLEVSSTTEDRLGLYIETVERTMESPILGFGAPRPSNLPGAPAVGTQGQLWTVIFSHGFGAVVPFMLWFITVFFRHRKSERPIDIAITGMTLSITVMIFYYGIINAGLVISFTAMGVLMVQAEDEMPRKRGKLDAAP